MYKNRIYCPLKCNHENPQIDTHDHLLKCTSLNIENPLNLTMHPVFADIAQQEAIGKLICKTLRKRKKLLEQNELSAGP